jgi:hypothetical protein
VDVRWVSERGLSGRRERGAWKWKNCGKGRESREKRGYPRPDQNKDQNRLSESELDRNPPDIQGNDQNMPSSTEVRARMRKSGKHQKKWSGSGANQTKLS